MSVYVFKYTWVRTQVWLCTTHTHTHKCANIPHIVLGNYKIIWLYHATLVLFVPPSASVLTSSMLLSGFCFPCYITLFVRSHRHSFAFGFESIGYAWIYCLLASTYTGIELEPWQGYGCSQSSKCHKYPPAYPVWSSLSIPKVLLLHWMNLNVYLF